MSVQQGGAPHFKFHVSKIQNIIRVRLCFPFFLITIYGHTGSTVAPPGLRESDETTFKKQIKQHQRFKSQKAVLRVWIWFVLTVKPDQAVFY